MAQEIVTVTFISCADNKVCEIDGKPVGPEYFGVDDTAFREWLEYNGMPRCGGFTKSGRRCNFAHSGLMCLPDEFTRRHRVEMCHLHQKIGAFRHVLDGGCVLITPHKFLPPETKEGRPHMRRKS